MHRNERFSADFLYRMQNLLQVLCPYLIQKYKEMPVETQELNRSLANFLKVSLLQKLLAVFQSMWSYPDLLEPVTRA
jgi:uncharacterized membrane protein